MTKIHFRPYNPNQTVLFPQRIDEDIAENDPVRMVDALVKGLNLESFRKLYKECGRSPYHPKMMLKVNLYAYMNNISGSLVRIRQEARTNDHVICNLGVVGSSLLSDSNQRPRDYKSRALAN